MTIEYQPGSEDIYITVTPRPDGYVSLGVYLQLNNERLYGLVLPPETARSAAEKLTLASWKAEEFKKWQDDQRE